VRSSWAFEGLESATVCFVLEGVPRGEGITLGAAMAVVAFDGVGRLGSLVVAVCPGLGLGTVRFGEAMMVFGVTAFDRIFSGGLACSVEGCSWLRTEYGPAVAGRAVISGLLFAGLIGAPVRPPEAGVGCSIRERTVGIVAVEDPEAWDEFETVLAGEK
jgi:hypothetical protein